MARRAAQSSEFRVHCKATFDLAMKLESGPGSAKHLVSHVRASMPGLIARRVIMLAMMKFFSTRSGEASVPAIKPMVLAMSGMMCWRKGCPAGFIALNG
jgi:hypothetical protein